ncbi:MAG: decaprenyl-phosphate phosphoribosyltransferase [Chloroflexota bacterium]|nr:decaprenyl-phosphate phosphoribosyltransferase [Chloroflexota bacterium]MDE2946281.1 decaprenyl-phosphate phosphoribosyltransferase [Chloroflexota bacterium]
MLDIFAGLIATTRPKQWTKNVLFVFPAIVFSEKLFEPDLVARVIICCILLILSAGSVYIFNDLADLDADRAHPVKRLRPIAAGRVPVSYAKLASVALPLLALIAAFQFDTRIALLILAYFGLQLAYSLYLKHIVLLDILAVAAGFVLRVIAGGIVIDVSLSPWLYASAGLLALFLVIGKRRQELALHGDIARETRPVFSRYNLLLLDDMLRVVTTATMITYIIYTVESPTMIRNGEHLGLLTVPFVFYGLFRYLYLIHVEKRGGAPDEVLMTDRPLQATLALAAFAYFLILYVL